MFTGIIEDVGLVEEVRDQGSNKDILVSSSISAFLRADQSLSHNGVCLTITSVEGKKHWATVVRETLLKSNLGKLVRGSEVNLERSMPADGRFDGHFVQAHVDQTGIVKSINDENGSWLFEFSYEPSFGHMTVEKGSVCVNGVSLTCFNSREGGFNCAVIPYTHANTNFKHLKAGDTVNLEFDILGKYVKRVLGT